MNEDLIKIAFVILIFAFFAVMLKSYRPEYAMDCYRNSKVHK